MSTANQGLAVAALALLRLILVNVDAGLWDVVALDVVAWLLLESEGRHSGERFVYL